MTTHRRASRFRRPVVIGALIAGAAALAWNSPAQAQATPDHYFNLIKYSATQTVRHGLQSLPGEVKTFSFSGSIELDSADGYRATASHETECIGSWGGAQGESRVTAHKAAPGDKAVTIDTDDFVKAGFFHCAYLGDSAHIQGATQTTKTIVGNGSAVFSSVATSGNGDGDQVTTTWTISNTVLPDNFTPPVSARDDYTGKQGFTIDVDAAHGVLANDSDPNGNPMHAVLQTGAVHGPVYLKSDGSFVYSPASSFAGVDSFTYRADNDSAAGTPTLVYLTVTPKPAAPVANPDSYTVFGQRLRQAAPGLLVNDKASAGVQIDILDQPKHGALLAHSDGSFEFTPTPGYAGPDSFTYQLFDPVSGIDGFSVPATVSLTITKPNAAPVAKGDAYTVKAGTTLTVKAPGVLGNDSDPEHDPVTAGVESPTHHGNLSLSSNGSFTYKPATGFKGSDTFTYSTYDGARGSNLATATIVIN